MIIYNTNTGDHMKEENERIQTVKVNSAMYNINVDCNSKEGKMLVEVVEKESGMEKLED